MVAHSTLPGVDWLAQRLGLTLLPSKAPTIVAAAAACFVLQLATSPLLSSAFTSKYSKLRPKTKRDWDIRVVAFTHAIFASIAATLLIRNDKVWNAVNTDKSFGSSPEVATIVSISTGYFLWDSIVSLALVATQGPGFLIHAVACLSVFILGHRPIFQYFACVFLLWEVSSIFLNIHWALDKLGLTGTRYQFVNGVILLSTFFGARLVYGNYVGYHFWKETRRTDVQAALPGLALPAFQLAMVSLTLLNAFWFRQMIFAITKRFNKKAKQKGA